MAVGRKFSSTYSLCEDLLDWHFVLDGFEKGVEAQFRAVPLPYLPYRLGGLGSTYRDSGGNRFFRSAEITDETICLLGVHI